MPQIYYPELEAKAKRDYYRINLSSEEDEKLLRIFSETRFMFGAKLMTPGLPEQPEEFYRGVAAFDVLNDRHGPEFIEKYTGIRQPKPMKKRILDLVRRL